MEEEEVHEVVGDHNDDHNEVWVEGEQPQVIILVVTVDLMESVILSVEKALQTVLQIVVLLRFQDIMKHVMMERIVSMEQHVRKILIV